MLKPLAALLPLLALPALGQQAQPGTVPPLTFPVPTVTLPPLAPHLKPVGCPVFMSASPQSLPHAVWVSSVEDAALPGTRSGTGVHVRLESIFQKMAKLSVEVSYRVYDGVYPITTVPPRVQSKTFELTSTGFHAIERNLLVAPHAEVLEVRVLNVTYADGTEWQAEFSGFCHVKPSHVLLVGTR